MSWSEHADRVIREAVKELSGQFTDTDEMFKFISKKYYPYGERQYWPYKAWLKAIKRAKNGHRLRQYNFPEKHDPNQIVMFERKEAQQ